MIGASTLPPEPKNDPNTTTVTLIRGTLPLSNPVPLIHLVRCLCPENGKLGEFEEWDRVYNSCAEARAPKGSIRLRTHRPPSPNAPRSTLIYYGPPDRRIALPCERRSVTAIEIGLEADSLLSLLGCTFAFEYMRRGLRCRTRNGITIDIFTVEKFQKRGDIRSATSIIPDHDHAVIELSCEETVSAEELEAFVQQLSPYIHVHSPPQRKMSPKRRFSPKH